MFIASFANFKSHTLSSDRMMPRAEMSIRAQNSHWNITDLSPLNKLCLVNRNLFKGKTLEHHSKMHHNCSLFHSGHYTSRAGWRSDISDRIFQLNCFDFHTLKVVRTKEERETAYLVNNVFVLTSLHLFCILWHVIRPYSLQEFDVIIWMVFGHFLQVCFVRALLKFKKREKGETNDISFKRKK